VVERDYGSGLGALLFTATLHWHGTPAVVLAYAVKGRTGGLDHRVFVMSQGPCTLLTALSL
jgi:hypothetical protein